MPETIQGTATYLYFTSPSFSAGVMVTEDDEKVRFSAKFHVVQGDTVTLVGSWKKHPKYGREFAAASFSYELGGTCIYGNIFTDGSAMRKVTA